VQSLGKLTSAVAAASLLSTPPAGDLGRQGDDRQASGSREVAVTRRPMTCGTCSGRYGERGSG
jgi:hypothetical protein